MGSVPGAGQCKAFTVIFVRLIHNIHLGACILGTMISTKTRAKGKTDLGHLNYLDEASKIYKQLTTQTKKIPHLKLRPLKCKNNVG